MEPSRPNQIKTTTKDGVPLAVGNLPLPERMFFYERWDGSVINVGERDAAKMHSKFKYLGQTDGMDYMNKIRELQSKFQEMTMPEIQQAMRDAMKAEQEKAKLNTAPPVLQPLNLNLKEQIPTKIRDSIQFGNG